MKLPRKTFVAVPLAVMLIAAGLLTLRLALQGPAEAQFATVLREPALLPEFTLVDQDGRPFGRDRLRGRFSLLFFGFTHCPDICPATLQQLALARDRIAADVSALPDIVLISVDPERDTPQLLADYTASFGPGVIGVTGEVAELHKLTAALGIFFEKSAASGSDYEVAHTAAVLLVNDRAELAAIFGAPHSIDDFVGDLPLLLETRR